jgi:chemotaxis protein histidine kinase CheA
MIINNDLSIEELVVFIEETNDQLRLLTELINDLKENNDNNKNIILQIFRIVHNMKGSSSMVGHTGMEDTIHDMEDILENLRNNSILIDFTIIENFIQFLDIIKKSVNELCLITAEDVTSDMDILAKSGASRNPELAKDSAGKVTDTLSKFVRTMSHDERKNIDFIVSDGALDFNQVIVKQVKDSLIHLLRNSITHGIESTQERKEKGKLENAFIKLSGYKEKGYIIIKLEDDGRGIDFTKVLSSAVNNGVIPANHAKHIARDKIIDLIFSAGITTTEKVTKASGRGMGLDIVRQKINYLDGSVTVDTQLGKGTIFTIKIPDNKYLSSQN